MNLVITSEMRVGSRWIHYLLSELLGKKCAPEIDDLNEGWTLLTRKWFLQNRIVKFHHVLPATILAGIPQTDKIIGIVRNPRDRLVSIAFHYRNHPQKHNKAEAKYKTDGETVRACVAGKLAKHHRKNDERMLEHMLPGCSTRSKGRLDVPYIWSAYEWLIEDTEREVRMLLDFVGADVDLPTIRTTIEKHSFELQSGRRRGQEKRHDTWRRKGVVNDWQNWFDDEMKSATQDVWEEYWVRLGAEEKRGDMCAAS